MDVSLFRGILGALLTQSQSKEIRQRSRCIIHRMELASLEYDIPIGSISTKSSGDPVTEYYHAIGIV